MRIALLGAGVMGSAVLTSIVAAEGVSEVVVADVNEPAARRAVATATATATARPTLTATTDTRAAVAGSDVVILALKPQHLGEALVEVGDAVDRDALVVSIAAGITTSWLAARVSAGAAIVRVMPNTPATIGRGVSAISPGPGAGEVALALTERLFAGTGLVLRVPESLQSVVTAVSGSGPAYVFAMIDALAEAGTTLGLPRELALRLAAHTVAGSGEYAVASGTHPALLREAVSSPGGTTLAALRVLDERAVRAAYVAAVRAASERADELAATE